MSDELRVSVRFKPKTAEEIKKAIEEGGYSHVSEFIRDAVRDKLKAVG